MNPDQFVTLQCKNCGAPLEPTMPHCIYCNTPYQLPTEDRIANIDLSPSLSIQLQDGKLVMSFGSGPLFSRIQCPHCKNIVPLATTCERCGNLLPQGIPCPNCGKQSNFGLDCSHCGHTLGRVIELTKRDTEGFGLAQMLGSSVLRAALSTEPTPPISQGGFVQEIRTIALRLLAQSGLNIPFDMRASRDGGLEFLVGNNNYPSVDDIPDANLRRLLHQAVDEWQKQN